MRIIVYSRAGCHLCDDAVALLAEYGLQVSVVDIDKNAQLLAKYDLSVPVVEIDDVVRFRGRIERLLLERLIAGSTASSTRHATDAR